jgi:hypothetical protein
VSGWAALSALAAFLALAVLPAAPASAGRLLVTGHDADLHCADGGQQCHFVKVALDYVRAGAPNPSAPVLVLDRLDLDLSRALDTPPLGGPGAVPRVVIDPRKEFATHPLATDRYSAIAIASDTSCGGCDLNEPFAGEGGDTPDSDVINARQADLEAFFNAGGGIYANSGADHANGDARDGADVFYDFLPLPATGAAVQTPFCLTDAGKTLGFQDTGCPDPGRHSGDGSIEDINCCPTHNSFLLPPADGELRVAETDGAGLAETLFAEGEIRGGELVRPRLPAPSPVDQTPPETTIVAGPSGTVRDRTPTFTFASSEAGSTFTCSLDGGPFVPCASPYTVPRLGAGRHTFAVRASDAAGNVEGAAALRAFEIALRLAELPPPTVGRNVNVEGVAGGGSVLVALPRRTGASARASQKGLRWVPLEQARRIPVRSFLDTRRGAVRLQSARNRRRVQTAVLSRAIFQVLQSRRRRARGLTELRLKGGRFRRCRLAGRRRAGVAALRRPADAARRRPLSRRVVRRLRARARGRFRTRGRHSAATVRGTTWTTYDRCDGTLTKVRRGRVVVRDFRRRRSILVHAGKGYLARPRPRPDAAASSLGPARKSPARFERGS